MDPTLWKQVKTAFEQALDSAPGERKDLLDRSCRGRPEARKEVERLLREHARCAGFLEFRDGARGHGSALPPGSFRAVGTRVGSYRIEGVLGSGGMGTVYSANRVDEHFHRKVALKFIKAGLDSEDLLRRFRNERQLLAELEHPGIARLYDGGVADDGSPFLVMEYVAGERIDRYCDARDLSVEERLRLFLEVCAAVQYAHDNSVVHRDLKPGNILVGEDGSPKLLDFGIAKVLPPEDSNPDADRTATTQRRVTYRYASPEMIRGGSVTTTTDVYSLGILLYELLTGHRAQSFSSSSVQDMERSICETDPLPPSVVVAREDDPTVPENEHDQATGKPKRGRSLNRNALAHRLRGDLDNIIMMALCKDPARRFASARALAQDIQRHLDGQPVLARASTWIYRFRKLLSRRRAQATGIVLLALILLTMVVAVQREMVAEASQDQTAALEYLLGRLLDDLNGREPDPARLDRKLDRELDQERELLRRVYPGLSRSLESQDLALMARMLGENSRSSTGTPRVLLRLPRGIIVDPTPTFEFSFPEMFRRPEEAQLILSRPDGELWCPPIQIQVENRSTVRYHLPQGLSLDANQHYFWQIIPDPGHPSIRQDIPTADFTVKPESDKEQLLSQLPAIEDQNSRLLLEGLVLSLEGYGEDARKRLESLGSQSGLSASQQAQATLVRGLSAYWLDDLEASRKLLREATRQFELATDRERTSPH